MTMPSKSRLILFAAAGCAAASCSAAKADPGDPSVPHIRLDTPRVLVLSPAMPGLAMGVVPKKDQTPITTLTAGETVFFRNPSPSEFAQVRIDGDFTGCVHCATVTGFACLKHGAVSRAIEPGGVASVCFHEAGRFEVRVESQGQTLGGVLEVVKP